MSDLIKRIRDRTDYLEAQYAPHVPDTVQMWREAAEALEALNQDIEDLKHDNASMLDSLTKESVARCEAEDRLEIATQELKNIANADTIAWDDPTQYEAWAKSRARWAMGKVEKKS